MRNIPSSVSPTPRENTEHLSEAILGTQVRFVDLAHTYHSVPWNIMVECETMIPTAAFVLIFIVVLEAYYDRWNALNE